MTRSTIDGVDKALKADTNGLGSAVVTVGASMVTNNTYAWSQVGTGSVVRSLGNNDLTGNGTSAGVLAAAAPQ